MSNTAKAPVTQTVPTQTLATETSVTMPAVQANTPTHTGSAKPEEIRKDEASHSEPFSPLQWVVRHPLRSIGALILIEVITVIALVIMWYHKRRTRSTLPPPCAEEQASQDFALWVKLVAGEAEEPQDDSFLFQRAAERLPSLTAEEQRQISEAVFAEWSKRVEAQIKAKAVAEDQAAKATNERDEAQAEVARLGTRIKELENEVGKQREAAENAENLRQDLQSRLSDATRDLEHARTLVLGFTEKETKLRQDAAENLKRVQDEIAPLRNERENVRAENDQLRRELSTARETIATRDAAIAQLNQRGASNETEIRRIAQGVEIAVKLEELQWIAQNRFARKVDDASISSVFLMAGYLAAFQFLRGVVENDPVLRDLGVINLRTLLEKISVVTGVDDWKTTLRELVPNAFDPQLASHAVDMSGPPQPEQLLFLSMLNHMGSLSEARIDKRSIRVSPLLYRAEGQKVRGVR